MTTLGRYPFVVPDSPAFDLLYDALPGVTQDHTLRSNLPAWACTTDLAATGTGVAIGVRKFMRKGDVVTALTFVSGNTAAATPTNYWHALYDPDGNKIAQSVDQGSAAWAANTAKRLVLSGGPYTISADGWYICATSSTAGTVQTLIGSAPIVTATAAIHTGSKPLGFTFGSTLGGTAPSTTGTQTGVAKCPLVVVS